MRFGKKNDPIVQPTVHLSGILYTAKRMPLSTKDLELQNKKQKPRLQLLLEQLFKKWADNLWRFKRKRTRPFIFAEVNNTIQTDEYSKSAKSKTLYVVVSVACLAAIAVGSTLMLFVFNPAEKSVKINDMGRVIEATTNEPTVRGFFDEKGITLDDADVVDVSLGAKVENGMEITIRRAMPLTVMSGDKEIEVKMLAGTVAEALARAGVDPASDDEVYPSEDSYVRSGMTINHIQVQVKYVTEEEKLEYQEISKDDGSIAKGKEILYQKGETGLQRNKIKVVYKNGTVVSRTVVSEEVVKKPVNKVIHVGTYVAPVKKSTTTTTSSGGGGTDGSQRTVPTTTQIHSSRTLYEHRKAVPPDPSIIAKTVIINHVTAYTHSGNRTAIGTWPKIGTIAADPKRFPYGTKVYVPGYGYGRIEDTGGFRNESRTVFDLFMNTERDCLQWGRKYNLKVYILK